MTLSFTLLAQMPQFVPTVARWLYDEWGHERPGTSPDSIAEDIRAKLDPTTLPVHLLALDDQVPAGVAFLKPHEMRDVFPERTPWLGSAVVAPHHRHNGIGSALTLQIEELARLRGFSRLYLQTERDDGGLYARLGWETCDRLEYRHYRAHVMTKLLGPSPAANR